MKKQKIHFLALNKVLISKITGGSPTNITDPSDPAGFGGTSCVFEASKYETCAETLNRECEKTNERECTPR